MPIENKIIEKKFVILCEGLDAQRFLISFLESDLAKSIDSKLAEDVQVLDFGGITQLEMFLANMQNMDGYRLVKKILVIRDAEHDSNGAICSIHRSMEAVNLNAPKHLGVWSDGDVQTAMFLFPDFDSSDQTGALEDLCIELLDSEDKLILKKAEIFLLNIQKTGRAFPRMFKNKLHTTLSANDKFVGMKIGEAAQAGAFNWNNGKMRQFAEFISQKL